VLQKEQNPTITSPQARARLRGGASVPLFLPRVVGEVFELPRLETLHRFELTNLWGCAYLRYQRSGLHISGDRNLVAESTVCGRLGLDLDGSISSAKRDSVRTLIIACAMTLAANSAIALSVRGVFQKAGQVRACPGYPRRRPTRGQENVMRFAAEPDAYTYKSLIAYLGFRLKQKEENNE
jgi:hypothetical protein